MRTYTTSINKMIKSFDKELKALLQTDLKVVKLSHETLIKKITSLNSKQLKTA